MSVASVECSGRCVSRNGEYEVSSVVVEDRGDGTARIGFVSRRLRRGLKAGAEIDAAAMDRLCAEWAAMRGAPSGRPAPPGAAEARSAIAEASAALARASAALGGGG